MSAPRPTVTTELEHRLYAALKLISSCETSDRILQHGERTYGISGEECLEMAYDNIREQAKRAINGVRVPAQKCHSTDQALRGEGCDEEKQCL